MRSGQFYVANISTFPPRRCGVGSFAKDMIESFLNDPRGRVGEWLTYPIVHEAGKTVYPARYRMHIAQEIVQDNPSSYEDAARSIVMLAKELRSQGSDMGVFLNHEYGIFAEYHTQDNAVRLLEILKEGDVASVIVGHTVLTNDSREDWEQKRDVMVRMIQNSDKFICITPSARKALMNPDLYFRVRGGVKEIIPRGKLIDIAHGIPEVDFDKDRNELKRKYGFVKKDGTPRKLATSVGFLSPSKGIEYILNGLSGVLKTRKDRDNILYLVAGATHEEILKQEGESYRESLIKLAKEKNIRGAVITRKKVADRTVDEITDLYGNKLEDLTNVNLVFLNAHLDDRELLGIMKMSDYGVIGNLAEEQISSGPGTYWIGTGRITIATESLFFKDMEDQGIGLLVPFKKGKAFYDRLNYVLDLSPKDREELEHIASDFGSANTWNINGQKYLNVLNKIMIHKAGKRL
ncbi:hypothetical protein A3K73_00935 [Candidatus Pacearchaeota archaeon RBG_13_36_9]|nr:MAG: hypothetical protein A3K73_00935 [Candidatus Pacearchaeota archaeon RBG_13_36_9]